MRVKLEDVCERGTSSLMQKDIVDKNGKYPVYGASGRIGSMETYQQEHQTVAVVKDGAGIGRTMLLPEKSSVIGTMQYLIPKNCIESEYLYYVVKYMHLEKYFSGATIPHIYFRDYKTEEFNLHDKTEQREIVSTLKRIEAIISNRQEQLTKLDELIKARFVEMFGDPYTNSKDYPLKKGESFFKLSNGKAVPESKRLNGGIPAYGGNGISWYTDESLFDADTIVVGRVGFQSGNVHLVKGPLWVTDNAMYMSSCDFSQYNLTFLIELMAHVDFTKFQDAGDLKKITQKPFMQFEYLCPPLSLQNQFSAFVAEVDKSKLLVGSAAAHKPFDIGFFSQKHCATPCKRGIISSKHVIFH